MLIPYLIFYVSFFISIFAIHNKMRRRMEKIEIEDLAVKQDAPLDPVSYTHLTLPTKA